MRRPRLRLIYQPPFEVICGQLCVHSKTVATHDIPLS